jgi:ribonuclease D
VPTNPPFAAFGKNQPINFQFISGMDYVNIQSLFKRKHKTNPGMFDNELVSLSDVYKHVKGIPLRKNLGISHWAKNNLTIAQIKYAAFDAFVLLEIYDYYLAQDEDPVIIADRME